ncbi:tRNA 5-methoxyuridine(34)/uridine 5-oxyacetic acid(34) synthase CmoB [Babesia caballi]|uniref:tRNA 5-methoxyuridine(34)/uridine 5-oxyacetic acid(34) synthase CmoB n=1 Tax=Babesia caballi TaxID=5871 RepID=A0AAV4LSS4_BABCB|nr:tRNA 5-methoxyuridine(34)/uridine 5-oxyacetic acid(34) synthase CmoB [Babesia caballi]
MPPILLAALPVRQRHPEEYGRKDAEEDGSALGSFIWDPSGGVVGQGVAFAVTCNDALAAEVSGPRIPQELLKAFRQCGDGSLEIHGFHVIRPFNSFQTRRGAPHTTLVVIAGKVIHFIKLLDNITLNDVKHVMNSDGHIVSILPKEILKCLGKVLSVAQLTHPQHPVDRLFEVRWRGGKLLLSRHLNVLTNTH